MSDRWALLLAVSAAMGAARPSALPLVAGVAGLVAALVLRRPAVLCLAVAALASSLATRSLAGLDGVAARPLDAEVTLVADPEPTAGGGVRVDAHWAGRRVELRAGPSSAGALAPLLAGERAQVRGAVRPAPPEAPWLTVRHVGAIVDVHAVEGTSAGSAVSRLANGLRRTLAAGAAPLAPDRRSLYLGLVIGDDRGQPAALRDDFLGAGLTHVLAVSGQNVAFAIAIAGPLLRRLRLWPRLVATLAVVAAFGLVTRFEPSVLRATAMAALAATLTTAGRPVSRVRVLSLAVTGLLLVDPLLVGAVGFRLSVAAAAAITLVAPRLVPVLPGPAPLRDALAVTLAAQLGVSPVLLATFGPLPVASLPANLLAVPAAGAVMVWGCTAGLVAGALGGTVAGVAHVPTRLLLGWIAGVAERAAALPLGHLGSAQVAVLAGGLAVAVLAHQRGRAALQRTGLAIAASALAVAVVAAGVPAPLRADLAPGVVRWHRGGADVVVLGGGGRTPLRAPGVLAALRQAGVGAVDLLVLADRSVDEGLVGELEARHPVGTVVTPDIVAPPGGTVTVGSLVVAITVVGERLVVEAAPGTR